MSTKTKLIKTSPLGFKDKLENLETCMTVEPIDTQQLLKKVKLFEAIVNRTQDAILVFNHLGEVIFGNSCAGHLLGSAPERLRGKKLSSFIPIDKRQKHEKLVALFTESKETRQNLEDWNQVQCCRLDGSLFPANIIIHKYSISEKNVFIVSMRDMSDAGKAENEKKVVELDLFRAEQLKKYSADTLQKNMEKAITQIAKTAQLVKDSSGNKFVDEHMNTILNSAFTAISISQKAAFFTDQNLSRDKLNLVDQSLYGTFERIRSILEDEIQKKKLDIEWKIPAITKEFNLHDSRRVEQIFFNIIEDALGNVSKGVVTVQISDLKLLENKKLEIEFKCESPSFGIPQHTMDMVLNATSNKTVPGSNALKYEGKCLRLAKHLIDEGEGSMRVVSHPINGTGIFVKLTEPLLTTIADKISSLDKRKSSTSS